MSKTMLVNVTHVEESRVAILEDGVLEQYEIETINRTNIKGNIHNAVVENVHPALEAAFLRISSDMKGFLPLDEVNFKLLPARTDSRKTGKIGQHLHPGQKIMVQVVREPFAGKPPTVTTYFSLPGRYLVLMPGVDAGGISRKIEDPAQRDKLKAQIAELNPPEGFGLIVRTAGVGQSKLELQRDLRYLLRLWESIQRASRTTEFPGRVYRERDLVIRTMRDYFTPDIDEVWIDNPETYERALAFVSDVMPSKAKIIKLYTGDRPLFSKWNLEEQIENVYKRRVSLRSGGEIVIDGTEALTAIDVNSKGAPRGGDAEENATSTNLEAAVEISRQLRLRDLGGLVVIDFIDMMAARNQKKVEKTMRDAMKGDRAKYDVTRISKLGLMEIARQRIRAEKMGASYTTCPMCEGYGLVKNIEPAGLAALRKLQMRCQKPDFGRVRMGVPPEIAHWILNHKRDELVALERRHNVRIHIEPKSTFLRHESEFEFFPREKVEVPPALVILDRPAPPAPPDLKELEAAQKSEAADKPAAEPVAASSSERTAASAPTDAAEEKGENGRRRRRRRRRRGRGGAEVENESTIENTDEPPDVEATGEDSSGDVPRKRNVAAMPSVIDIEPSAVEPVDADEELADDGETDTVEEPVGAGVSAGTNGDDGGPRKRRRRRRRRGRGGAAAERTDGPGVPAVATAPAAAHARNDLPPAIEPPPIRVAEPDEIVVPRHIQAEELLPAATGGRRRKQQGDGPPLAGTAAPPPARRRREQRTGTGIRTDRGLARTMVRAKHTLVIPIVLCALAAARATIPVATYSIVARDAKTGELGVAVQSHWFSVGATVPWAEPGVGAVATQSFVEPSYGPKGLAAMRAGMAPDKALKDLVAADPHPEGRQVAFVDALGRAAAYTGPGCIPAAGHRTGEGYSVQANLMLSSEVPDAMAAAFEKAEGPLAERMLKALEAAQAVGGDIRGKQSAAILVVRAKPSAKPWTDRRVDLRIEDHAEPLVEMRRLLTLHRAYERMNNGDDAVAAGHMDEALREYSAAQGMVPGNDEFVFWTAVTLVQNARIDNALPMFAKAFRMNPGWMILVPRLAGVGQLPNDPKVTARILAVGPKP